MTADLFVDQGFPTGMQRQELAPGAVILRQFAAAAGRELLAVLHTVAEEAAFRCMTTPGGRAMSVAMTNCGRYGWVTDAAGYRYTGADPVSGLSWPAMPECVLALAAGAAARAGFPGFSPDACLINRYQPGARLSLHRDSDEQDFRAPIVSVSLGVPAVFQFGGARRADRPLRVRLEHGDVLVWGGPARLRYHGVMALKPAWHPLTGACRYNLTIRKAGP